MAGRLNQVRRFAGSAFSLRELPAMCLLGLARCSPFNGESAIGSLGRKVFPSLRVRPRALRGGAVDLNTADLGQLVSYEEIMVDGGYDLSLVPFAPAAVVDCGAHVGLFTLLAAVTFPDAKFTAFEPSPENLQWLRRNLQINQLECDLRAAAVGIQDGIAEFKLGDSNAGCIQTGTVSDSANRIQVAVTDLRRVLHEMKPGSLLLKLDIEGEERTVLPAIMPVLPANCAVFFETHDGEEGWQQAVATLGSAGFVVRCLRARSPFYDGYALRTAQQAP